ncbi:hypothetical protein J0383_13115 [Flavobacterium endoglycinae]|uniref:Uncharacterized protein n=1 Tax=Flavobacterium endoglycinae TaxID=2816357 RepID=A0ABX7Q8H6_9FLAO|nr:hypothetical protein [Flavobacterium endoglycinae]QSW87237.1 hypothetical protein J0383_13115 [Flavobacterium endoglycinae]
MQEKESKFKRNIWLFVAIAIALALVTFFQFYLSENTQHEHIEITQLVDKYNKNCPLLIQEGIRLDSVNLPEERAVQYNLTLVKVEKETAEIAVIRDEIKKSILSTAKANPGLQVFRENDYTLIYSYYDNKKKFLFKVNVLPDQYQ